MTYNEAIQYLKDHPGSKVQLFDWKSSYLYFNSNGEIRLLIPPVPPDEEGIDFEVDYNFIPEYDIPHRLNSNEWRVLK